MTISRREGLTIDAAIDRAARKLRQAGVEGPGRDARALVSAAIGLDRTQLLSQSRTVLHGSQQDRIDEFIDRRCRREPVSRILGWREFYGREFEISPATLDPRPDSETIIEAVLHLLAQDGLDREAPVRIIDVGTGSGCLIVTLLAELPNATGLGTDIEPEALRVAEQNAVRHGVGGRVRWSVTRSLESIDGPFDLLVANPPYIPTGDIKGLDPEVREYDPETALDGGPDGLDVYREIAQRLPDVIPGGWAVFEVGAGQANSVKTVLTGLDIVTAMPLIRVFRDLNGVDRCVAWKARG